MGAPNNDAAALLVPLLCCDTGCVGDAPNKLDAAVAGVVFVFVFTCNEVADEVEVIDGDVDVDVDVDAPNRLAATDGGDVNAVLKPLSLLGVEPNRLAA